MGSSMAALSVVLEGVRRHGLGNIFRMKFSGMMVMSSSDARRSDWGWIRGVSARRHGRRHGRVGDGTTRGIPAINLGGMGIGFDSRMRMSRWG